MSDARALSPADAVAAAPTSRSAGAPAAALAAAPAPAAARVAGLVTLRLAGNAPARRVRVPRGLERLLGVAILFGVWELASRAGWVSTRTLAGPSTVLTAGWDLARDGTLGSALWASAQRVLWGAAFGIPIGTALALVAGLSRAGDDLVDATVHMLRFVPVIALQPLLIVWLGIGESVKVFLIALGVAFPVYVNTAAAIRAIHPGHRELARVLELGRLRTIRRIVLPGALPGFFVGLRLASAIAWLLLVFAEQINANKGIGYLMLRAQTFFQTDVIVVGLVVYAVLGLLSDAAVRALERAFLRWRP